MKKISTCPLCSKKKFIKKFDCLDHSTSKESFTIVSCETCGFVLTNPIPKENKLPEYYVSEKYISHTNKKEGLFNLLYQVIRKYTTTKKVRLISRFIRSGKLLDIGCGTGEFLNASKKFGYKIKGTEPSLLARNEALKNHNIKIPKNTNLSQFGKEEFDCVTMWHSLEHMPDLKKTLKEIKRILSEEGLLVIAVPNYKSWDASYYQEFWAAWDVPIHIWHFSKKTIKKLLSNYNFKLIKVYPMIFDSYYVSILSEEYKNSKKNFAKGFIIGLISNIVAITTSRGHSSQIYIFKKKSKNTV